MAKSKRLPNKTSVGKDREQLERYTTLMGVFGALMALSTEVKHTYIHMHRSMYRFTYNKIKDMYKNIYNSPKLETTHPSRAE